MTSYRTIYQTCSPCAYRRIKKSNDDSKHIPRWISDNIIYLRC